MKKRITIRLDEKEYELIKYIAYKYREKPSQTIRRLLTKHINNIDEHIRVFSGYWLKYYSDYDGEYLDTK